MKKLSNMKTDMPPLKRSIFLQGVEDLEEDNKVLMRSPQGQITVKENWTTKKKNPHTKNPKMFF